MFFFEKKKTFIRCPQATACLGRTGATRKE
jgi:hypothetical protein